MWEMSDVLRPSPGTLGEEALCEFYTLPVSVTLAASYLLGDELVVVILFFFLISI